MQVTNSAKVNCLADSGCLKLFRSSFRSRFKPVESLSPLRVMQSEVRHRLAAYGSSRSRKVLKIKFPRLRSWQKLAASKIRDS
jgi:hypothetical protein